MATATPPCESPFEKGPQVCRVCRLAKNVEGLKRCSKLVAESAAMRTLLVKTAPIAATNHSVILLGESGTGKEVLSRAIHANSPRREKPFIAINVAALPADLLESELFGHVKGAFTGAVANKVGLFEAASGGTLLLDEIAEMPLPLQTKLLRALQEGEVRRVGDTKAFSVDVRILCATHRNIPEYVQRGLFREDLYYRLKVFTLKVPPLRDRREDIMPLAEAFLEQEHHPTSVFTDKARKVLETYYWPGNIRELQNAVKHGAVLSDGQDIEPEHLPEELTEPAPPVLVSAGSIRPLADVEREHILHVFRARGENHIETARALQIGRNTLWRKLKAYGIESTPD